VADELVIPPSLIAARRLRPFPEAKHLEIAEVGGDGREHLLTPEAAAAWRQMKRAAAADGIGLSIVSGYRSVQRQTEIVRGKLAGRNGQDLSYPAGNREGYEFEPWHWYYERPART
jgi:D-alanyl-D-alanine carboxypeptidase